MESKLFTFINGLAKVSIFPFFYFATFFLILFITGYATDSFSRNYGEAIEGMALGMVYLAPALLLILIPVSLIILKLTCTMHFLKNDWFLGADIPEERIVFSNVAERSLAFHSSILGSRNRAFGADRAVTVTSSHIDPFKEHGFAVLMFADMLADMKTGENHRITPFFRLSNADGISLDGLPDAEGYDAWIDVRTELVDTPDGPQWQAQASALRFRNADGSWSTPLLDPKVENYSQSQPPSSGPGSYLP